MSLSKQAYQSLEDVVGPEYISTEPAITQAYSYMWNVDVFCPQRCRPEAVVLPKNTDEVQAVIQLANKYRFPFIPVGTMLLPTAIPTKPDTVIIDPKRMNKILEIDEKNMYAKVEPYVTYTQLQAETMKKGLTLVTPWCGSQVSVIANNLFQGAGGTNHKHGFNRGILGVEWILPNGEILKPGSAGMPGGKWFWGEGPGLNLKGLLRADTGHGGGMGMVTKMAVKLHPWPGPRVFPCVGTSPDLKCEFPEERLNYILLNILPMKSLSMPCMRLVRQRSVGHYTKFLR